LLGAGGWRKVQLATAAAGGGAFTAANVCMAGACWRDHDASHQHITCVSRR